MPQASEELRAKFPGSDTEALKVLEGKVTINRGFMRWVTAYKPTEREMDAIQYLCDEWDYGFDDSVL